MSDLPDGWVKKMSKTHGKEYYYNAEVGHHNFQKKEKKLVDHVFSNFVLTIRFRREVSESLNQFESTAATLTVQSHFHPSQTQESTWEHPGPGSRTNKVRASHLLVKHRDSRRPSSWKEVNITRSRDEALEILDGECSNRVFQNYNH